MLTPDQKTYARNIRWNSAPFGFGSNHDEFGDSWSQRFRMNREGSRRSMTPVMMTMYNRCRNIRPIVP
jgi:hypothetical protein